MKHIHHMPFGAEPSAQGTRFRLWAPGAETVAVVIEDGGGERIVPACDTGEGWYELHAAGVGAGTAYRYLIDGTQRVPDPAARAQRDDVHGPSLVVDPAAFHWRDGDWCGRPWESAVLYELHVGTFTRAGTFAGVQAQLDGLADLGITAIELMPVADFPGRRNWGYDGVLAYAPDRCYGTVDDLKALVQAAHARGLMMFLDVVYNHFGPEGNYLHAYAAEFFDPSRHTPWGAAIDFTRRQVREFFIHNALYWLEEFRFDGLRLDAVHAIDDPGAPHILEELAAAVAAGPGRERHVHLVLENDANEARFLQRDGAGCPRHYVAQWNDDLHHALHVLVSGERHGYYAEYAGAPARHLGRCLAEGFAWQGEPSPWRGGAARGQSTRGLPPTAFVGFLQNHDQIGNRAFGERITRIAPDAAVRAATAILLLAPSPPLLFMGQEWGATQPFPFFCDFGSELARAVREGRQREFAGFAQFSDPATRARIPDPGALTTFAAAVLDRDACDSETGRSWLALHRELLALRRDAIVPRLGTMPADAARCTSADPAVVHVRWSLAGTAVLELIANLGPAPARFDARPAGALLYGLRLAGDWDGMQLAPWSVGWFL